MQREEFDIIVYSYETFSTCTYAFSTCTYTFSTCTYAQIRLKAVQTFHVYSTTNSYKPVYKHNLASFFSVPSGLITSVSLSPPNPIGTVGSSVYFACTATLSRDVFGAVIEFDYGIVTTTMSAVSGTTQTDTAIITSATLSSAGEYTCTVNVTAPGVCGGGGTEPTCPVMTSDPVTLKLRCEYRHV